MTCLTYDDDCTSPLTSLPGSPAQPNSPIPTAILNVVLRQRDVNPQLAATSLSLFRAEVTGTALGYIIFLSGVLLHCGLALRTKKRLSGWLAWAECSLAIPTRIVPFFCTSVWIQRPPSGIPDLHYMT